MLGLIKCLLFHNHTIQNQKGYGCRCIYCGKTKLEIRKGSKKA